MTSFLVIIIVASWFNVISRKTWKILGHSLICPLFFFDLFHRLYRSIGEYDILRGIFSSEIGTKQITQDALLAEARSDYSEAARLYNEVELISSECVSCFTTSVLGMETLSALEFRPSDIPLYSLTFAQRLLPENGFIITERELVTVLILTLFKKILNQRESVFYQVSMKL